MSNGSGGTVTRIDPISNRPAGEPVRTGRFPTALTVGAGFVWVVNSGDGTVARIDPREDVVIGRQLPVGRDPQDIAVGHGSVWVANRGDGTITRLSASDGRRQGAPIHVGGAPGALAITRDAVLVLDTVAATCGRSLPRTGRVRAPLEGRRLPDVARGRRRERLGRRRSRRDRDAPAQQPVISLLLAAALAGAPAQRIEAETLRPGTVVRDGRASGGQALALSRNALRARVSGLRIRILVRAPRCDGVLRFNGRRARVAGGALALRGRVQPPRRGHRSGAAAARSASTGSTSSGRRRRRRPGSGS